MKKLIKLKTKTVIILYILIDVGCAGTGMGVPIFNILFGFPFGWYLAKRIAASENSSQVINSRILKISILSVLLTFFLMIAIWGITIPMLFDPNADFENFGHPFILFDPKISFIGWLVLMIFISPFLQLLTTIFAAFMALVRNRDK